MELGSKLSTTHITCDIFVQTALTAAHLIVHLVPDIHSRRRNSHIDMTESVRDILVVSSHKADNTYPSTPTHTHSHTQTRTHTHSHTQIRTHTHMPF